MSLSDLKYHSLNTNPIIIVDDSAGELELIQSAFDDLNVKNERIVFKDGVSFLEYMKVERGGFLFILCDINMPKITGIELKKIMQDDQRLRLKCIPFILLSTGSAQASVMEAYSYCVNGYFIKPDSFAQLKDMLHSMVTYWNQSQHPNA